MMDYVKKLDELNLNGKDLVMSKAKQNRIGNEMKEVNTKVPHFF